MAYRVSAEERLEELRELFDATDADALQRILVLRRPAAYETEPTLPMVYFTNAVNGDPTGACETAMLLVTDRRFAPTCGPLMERIETSGKVEDDHLDLLAEAFLRAGKCVYWAIPDEWFSTEQIIIFQSANAASEVAEDDDGDDAPAVAERVVRAPLRRWAAARLVARSPARSGSFLQRARDLGGEAGGAILRGLLDSVDHLPALVARAARTEALEHTRSEVRIAALELLARQDPAAARARALGDSSKKVRLWAATCPGTLPRAETRPPQGAVTNAPEAGPSSPLQVALF
jgi:hypothetical protein